MDRRTATLAMTATALLQAAAIFDRAPTPAYAADCRFAAAERGRIGAGGLVEGDFEVNDAGGELVVGFGVEAVAGTRLAGDRVRIRRGSRASEVAAGSLALGADVEIVTTSEGVGFPLDQPFCAESSGPDAPACGGAGVVVAGDAEQPLPPGVYARLQLARGATLVLAQGDFVFCSIDLRGRATLSVDGESTSVTVDGDVLVGRAARVASSGRAPRLAVAGEFVRLRRGARLDAELHAPAARVRISGGAVAAGGGCARSLIVGRRSRLHCSPDSCGDQVLDAALEECDGDADGACRHRCRLDCECPAPDGPWRFDDVTAAAGIDSVYAFDLDATGGFDLEVALTSGGAAAGDYDGDGFDDLYTVGGPIGSNRLWRNRGDGTFEDRAADAGVQLPGSFGAGPSFADYDGDGDLDLLVGGQLGSSVKLFRNAGAGLFEDVTVASELTSPRSTYGGTFGDADLDGDLDLFLGHWGSNAIVDPVFPEHLWRNEGDGSFTPATDAAAIDVIPSDTFGFVWTFTPNFSDVNGDFLPDLLLANDFETEQYFLNLGAGTFTEATTAVNSSENGMGSAIGDYDNDGDLDWFVTSIWDPNGVAELNWGVTGNRLYRNRGDGTFDDVTDSAGVRRGYWGWGACFADFDLDGDLDLFHVNGFASHRDEAAEFHADPSVFYLSNGDGSFDERAAEVGLADVGQGRAVVCFDYDRDGDIDVFIGNGEGQAARLLRNNGAGRGGFLTVRLRGRSPNTEAIGARVTVTAGNEVQVREVRGHNGFVSRSPAIAHFGVGSAQVLDRIDVVWPGGAVQTTLLDVAADSFLEIAQP